MRVCASGEVFRVHLPRSVSCVRLDAKRNWKNIKSAWRSGLLVLVGLVEDVFPAS